MRAFILTALLVLAGCASSPDTNPNTMEWYPRETNLATQAAAYKTHSVALITSDGVYSYRGYKPWGIHGDAFDNLALSLDMADYPAWQGCFMAALAFESAVTGQSNDALLKRLGEGLVASFEVTGVEGLMTRCVWPSYTGPRLPWMETPEQRPTKYWTQGVGGAWYRNGCAKNHLNLSMFGCAIPLALHRAGKIALSPATEAVLKRALVGGVTHLKNGGWRIRDVDGGFTEFGDLRPDVTFGPSWPELPLPNGFNRIILLHLLRSAGHYDAGLMAEYELRAPQWGPGIKSSMEAVGEAVKAYGHHKWDKPSFSDMQAFGLAAFSLLLQEDRRELRKHYTGGLVGLWEYMRYERNAMFTLPYVLARPNEARTGDVIEDLRQFPRPEDKGSWDITFRDSSTVQPLGNRPTNSNYYKSSPFRRVYWSPGQVVEPVTHPDTGARQLHGGQDFLLAYWMGRYLGVVPTQ